MIPVHTYNPVQLNMTTYTNPSQTQIEYKLDSAKKHSRKYKHDENRENSEKLRA